MSGTSSVGGRGVYEAGDQRTKKDSKTHEEGQSNSHLANDSKDERTIGNRLAQEEKEYPEQQSQEVEELKKDPTLPATNHGHEPSEGAKIDAQLQAEDKKALERKGAWGPK